MVLFRLYFSVLPRWKPKHQTPRVGFNVTKTEDSTTTFYRMQTVDPVGRSIWVTFEVPKDAGGSAAY